MEKLLILLLRIFLLASVNSETKFWRPQESNLDEWYFHPISCPKTALNFEDGTFTLQGNSHEKSIEFSDSGYWILSDNLHMVIGESPEVAPDECANAFGQQVTVHSPKSQRWTNPKNWESESNNNPAKPDIEKIPCDFDTAVFNSTVTRVNLEGLYEVKISQVVINGQRLWPREFGSFCRTPVGQKMFENSEETEIGDASAPPSDRLACQSNSLFYQSIVCETVKCEPAKCMDPIRPLGFCCPICGSSAVLEIHQNTEIKLNSLNNQLSQKLTQMGNSGLSFYTSYFNDRTKMKLQINVVERGDYKTDSVAAMEKIEMELLRHRYDYVIYKSGMPYDPTESSSVFAQVFLPLLVVIAILGGAYKVSYDEAMQFNWRGLFNRWTGRSQFIFAQFENVLEDREGQITISHSVTQPVVVEEETGVECEDNSAGEMEMVEGGVRVEKANVAKDKLDEIVETIGATESVNLISVDN